MSYGRLRKGSPEAKARMAYLRSLRRKYSGGSFCSKPFLETLSPETKAKLLDLRIKLHNLKNRLNRGGSISEILNKARSTATSKLAEKVPGALPQVIGKSLGFWVDYGKSWKEQSRAMKRKIKELEEMKRLRDAGVSTWKDYRLPEDE